LNYSSMVFFCSCPYVIDDYSHRILWTCEYILLLHFVKVLLLETTIQTEIPFTEVPLYSLTNASMFFCFQLKKKWNFALFRWNKLVFTHHFSSIIDENHCIKLFLAFKYEYMCKKWSEEKKYNLILLLLKAFVSACL